MTSMRPIWGQATVIPAWDQNSFGSMNAAHRVCSLGSQDDRIERQKLKWKLAPSQSPGSTIEAGLNVRRNQPNFQVYSRTNFQEQNELI